MTLHGRAAKTVLRATVFNPSKDEKTAAFFAPLPAGVESVDARLRGEPAKATIVRDERFRVLYDPIGGLPFNPDLTELFGGDALRVGAIVLGPGDRAELEIAFGHELAASGDRVDVALPLTNPFDGVTTRTLSIDVDATFDRRIASVESPSLAVEIDRRSERRVRLRLSTGPPIRAGPFRLTFDLQDESAIENAAAKLTPKLQPIASDRIGPRRRPPPAPYGRISKMPRTTCNSLKSRRDDTIRAVDVSPRSASYSWRVP